MEGIHQKPTTDQDDPFSGGQDPQGRMLVETLSEVNLRGKKGGRQRSCRVYGLGRTHPRKGMGRAKLQAQEVWGCHKLG